MTIPQTERLLLRPLAPTDFTAFRNSNKLFCCQPAQIHLISFDSVCKTVAVVKDQQ